MRNIMNKIKAIIYLIIMLFVVTIVLSSCSQISEGTIVSSLNMMAEISEFKTANETDSFFTTPCIFLTAKYTYLIRNFPSNLPKGKDAINKFINSGDIPKTIEIYDNYDYNNIAFKIDLKGIENRKIVFYKISCYMDFYFIIGKENAQDDYITKLYKFDFEGNLVDEHTIYIENINNAFIFEDFCYSIRSQSMCLVKYNLNTCEEEIISYNVISVFFSGDNIYFISLDDEDDFKKNMYIYTGNECKLLYDDLPVYTDISSAFFDAQNEVLYYADYSRIYICDIKKYNLIEGHHHFENIEVFKVSQSFVNILPCSELILLLEIGHNQVCIFQIGE